MIWFIASVVFIIMSAICASCASEIAEKKGFPEKEYFWLPFLFGIYGLLLVAALPDRTGTSQITYLIENQTSKIKTSGQTQTQNELPELF